MVFVALGFCCKFNPSPPKFMKMATYPDPATRFWEYASENWPLSPVLTVLGLLVLGLVLNWRKRSRPWLLAMSLILTGLCLALRLGVGVDAAAQLERAEVLRSGPGDAFLQLGKLEAGARVRVPDTAAREEAGVRWRQIRYGATETAWLPESALLLLN